MNFIKKHISIGIIISSLIIFNGAEVYAGEDLRSWQFWVGLLIITLGILMIRGIARIEYQKELENERQP